jgi:hypothetical protein
MNMKTKVLYPIQVIAHLRRTALAPLKKGVRRKRAIAFHLLFSINA